MRPNLLFLYLLRLLSINSNRWYFPLCFEQMLRILAPHVIVPLSLYRLLIADHLHTIVLQSLATMSIVKLDELIHHLSVFHVP